MRKLLCPLALTLALCTAQSTPSLARADAPAFRKVTQQELPAAIKPAGKLVEAIAWSDASGHNVAAFFVKQNEKQNSVKLQVTLWSGTPGTKGIIARTVKDGVPPCEGDVGGEFMPNALGVTDLDNDGYGELTFAYRTTCTTDVSPWLLKLLILERRDKYIMRGVTRIDYGQGEPEGGEHSADPELSKVPAFLSFAEKTWAAIVDQKFN